MSSSYLSCPNCHAKVKEYTHPFLTVDIIVKNKENEIILIERQNPPYGFALPGGFVDYNEKVEDAALRELFEETNLKAKLTALLGVYSDPKRDARMHTVSIVFMAEVEDFNDLLAKDDAKATHIFKLNNLPKELAFDHAKILEDYCSRLKSI